MRTAAIFFAMTVLISASALPASAHHAFWHQVQDQVSGAHQGQYGYGQPWNYSYNRHQNYNPYYGTNSGYGNYWGPSNHQQRDYQHATEDADH